MSFYELPYKVQTSTMIVNKYTKNNQKIPIGRWESSVYIKKIVHNIPSYSYSTGSQNWRLQRHPTAIWVFPKIVVPHFTTPVLIIFSRKIPMGLLGKPTIYGNTLHGGHRAVQDTALNRVCEVLWIAHPTCHTNLPRPS